MTRTFIIAIITALLGGAAFAQVPGADPSVEDSSTDGPPGLEGLDGPTDGPPEPEPEPEPTPEPTAEPEYGGSMEPEPEGEGGLDARPGPLGFAPVAVASVIPDLEGANSLCTKAGAYQIDCLANQYEEIAKSLGESRKNAEAREILEEVSVKLRDIARQNQSTTQPRARLRTADNSVRSTRRLVPVAAEQQAAAAAEAIAALSEAQTKLLRSSDSSNRQAYVQIAEVMESQKVLLRS